MGPGDPGYCVLTPDPFEPTRGFLEGFLQPRWVVKPLGPSSPRACWPRLNVGNAPPNRVATRGILCLHQVDGCRAPLDDATHGHHDQINSNSPEKTKNHPWIHPEPKYEHKVLQSRKQDAPINSNANQGSLLATPGHNSAPLVADLEPHAPQDDVAHPTSQTTWGNDTPGLHNHSNPSHGPQHHVSQLGSQSNEPSTSPIRPTARPSTSNSHSVVLNSQHRLS